MSRTTQETYVTTAMVMASAIASQTDKTLQSCFDDWYSGAPGRYKERNGQILGIIAQNPEYPPVTIILAVIEKKCGAFPKR